MTTITHEQTHIFTGKVSIRWRDIDPFGIVNHSIFFTLMEDVRLQWFATTGLQTLKYIYPIVDAHAIFKNKLTYPADVTVKLFVNTIKEKSWIFYHEIFNAKKPEEVCAEASLVSVVYDPKLNAVVPIPSEMTMALKKQF